MHRFTKETAAHVLNILDCNLMEKRGGEEGGRRREEEERKREEEEERGERGLGGEGRKRKIRGAEGQKGKKLSIVPFFQPLQTPGLRSTPLLCQPVYGSLTTERSVIPLGV